MFSHLQDFHKLSRKIAIELHSDSNINMLPHLLSYSLSALCTYARVCICTYIHT